MSTLLLTDVILDVVADKTATQVDIARVYAIGIVDGRVDWYEVNMVILGRYRESGLQRIKRLAWKRLEATQ